MVNANKHRVLKVVNEITRPERELRQEENNREFYNKNKGFVFCSTNWGKRPDAKPLELKYGKGV